jgi:hypothetical protein
MKTQLSKPARSKARYTQEYKQEALPDLSPGVCETRIRSVGRGSGSSRAPAAVGHAARSQGRGTGVGRGLGTGAHLPLHDL